LAKHLSLKCEPTDSYIEGGNFFIGQKPDNTKFAIVGKRTLVNTAELLVMKDLGMNPKSKEDYEKFLSDKRFNKYADENFDHYLEIAKEKIAKDLKLEPESVHYISQPEFHLDMKIRPLKYPYILINDYNLMIKELEKREDKSYKAKNYIKRLKRKLANMTKNEVQKDYVSAVQTEKELTDLGFKVIRVPGIVDRRANFMNAVVHERDNGELVYITNKTSFMNSFDIDLNNLFRKYLLKNAPDVKRVEFISGPVYENGRTFLEKALDDPKNGAIHCMASERPDFDKWG
jgi:hypothetical protein